MNNKAQRLMLRLMEECAELQQATAKAIEYGVHNGYPNTERTNLGDMRNEFTDLMAMIELLEEELGCSFEPCGKAIQAKKEKVATWMKYADEIRSK